MIRNVLTIAAINSKAIRGSLGTYLLMVFLMPVSFLIPLTIISGGRYNIDIAMGSLFSAMFITTIEDVGDGIVKDRYTGSRNFFITRPIKPVEYMLGIALSTLTYNGIGGAAILGICVLFLDLQLKVVGLAILILVLMAGWFISALIGFIIGEYGPKDWIQNDAISGAISFVVTFLAPVYYPLSALPSTLQPISYGFYTTHLALIGKDAMNGVTPDLANVVAVVCFLVACFVIALKGIKWREL